MVIPEEIRERGVKTHLEEIIAENFPNLEKETDSQVQEAQRFPNKMNPRRSIIPKMSKDKDKKRILKAAGEKQKVTYRG